MKELVELTAQLAGEPDGTTPRDEYPGESRYAGDDAENEFDVVGGL